MQINVLDKGYVRLVNSWGTDLDVVNSARVSYDKESNLREDGSLTINDQKLIQFLVKHKHDSTLRHCGLTFEVYAPLMVARQWYKHAVGSSHVDDQLGWNESSRRYVTENEEFYIPGPNEWRSAPENSKQGSGDPIDVSVAAEYYKTLMHLVEVGTDAYNRALADGVAPEQARLLLPAYGMYVRWRWTTSLNSALHFLSLRLKSDSQYEIRQYADAVNEIVISKFPDTSSAWNSFRV